MRQHEAGSARQGEGRASMESHRRALSACGNACTPAAAATRTAERKCCEKTSRSFGRLGVRGVANGLGQLQRGVELNKINSLVA